MQKNVFMKRDIMSQLIAWKGKKDRKPLRIKNLADLKRHIKLGTELVATAHQYHPDIIGLTRVVTKVQTNGFYSKIKDQPDH